MQMQSQYPPPPLPPQNPGQGHQQQYPPGSGVQYQYPGMSMQYQAYPPHNQTID